MINVYIISGFLGAGKTTFIQKLLNEKKFEKVMLLENEFGEVGVDSAFFSSSLAIKEINNGCICCSLQGDFEDALEEIEEMGVTDLIIEPSGVGKLSEIINVVKSDDAFRIVSHICVVDVLTCQKYHRNFGEYFNDQVKAANGIILSHVDVASEEKIDKAIKLVEEINDEADILDIPIANMMIEDLLDFIVRGGEIMPDEEEEECCCHHHHEDGEECCCHRHDHDEECHCHEHDEECHCHKHDEECCHHHHEDGEECCCHHHDHDEECRCHEHDEECHCHKHDEECCHHHHEDEEEHEHHHEHGHHHHHHHHHHHDEDEPFQNVVFTPVRNYTREEMIIILSNLDPDIIRVKGYVNCEEGTLYFNYILNEYNVFVGEKRDSTIISIIGTDLHEEELKDVFKA